MTHGELVAYCKEAMEYLEQVDIYYHDREISEETAETVKYMIEELRKTTESADTTEEDEE